ncbi:MAG: GNAT family N-acetyltransferase [Opitutae bacterium]|nr:GNAT family N-acetyltransferase [Opitutae bacterium]MBT6956888.1 GNAT family N-acetyltransferase [Opitutae bacterium]
MEFIIRRMGREDWAEVGELIYTSINYWYHTHGSGPKFLNGPESTQLFCKIYEDLDPGCCILVENPNTGRIAGSCFFHPRETHISIGIMNVHPNYFGLGAAKVIMREILDIAAKEEKPVRLVSSAMNLDSFTLYNRCGFTPRQTFQDMYIEVPSSGLNVEAPALSGNVRDAQPEDATAIADLEQELVGIRREGDFAYFIENTDKWWHGSVIENENGYIDGFLFSVSNAASNILGPGVARTEEQTLALLHAELNHNTGRSPVFLVPTDCRQLVDNLYGWGARNCELHFSQTLGEWNPQTGIILPTFMPETG